MICNVCVGINFVEIAVSYVAMNSYQKGVYFAGAAWNKQDSLIPQLFQSLPPKMTSHYPGMRLSFGDALCTVRYIGPLSGQNGDWLGVEWDDADRGKHNGQFKGKRLFETLSSSPNCASFVRPTRIADKPRSFLEALRYKYAEEGVEEKATADADGSD